MQPTIIFKELNVLTVSTKIPLVFQQQADLFRALSHPARIAILSILRDGEQCVCHLEAMLRLRQSYISQHLIVLREAGLVVDRRDGWNIFYRRTRLGHAKLSEALKIVSGKRPPRVQHAHAGDGCPCPKCARKRTEPAASIQKARSNADA
ncbi:MAG: metalloregulator ArsR/SmtB family transcription factor [Chloroflexota bacterium]